MASYPLPLRPAPAPRPRMTGKYTVLTVASALALLGAVQSAAFFSSTQTANNNAFSSGTVTLSLNPVPVPFNVTNMAPGDVTTRTYAVQYTGLPAHYDMTTGVGTNTKNLASQLKLTVRAAACDSIAGSTYLVNDVALSSAPAFTGRTAQTENLCVMVRLPYETTNDYTSGSATATFTFYAKQDATDSWPAVNVP